MGQGIPKGQAGDGTAFPSLNGWTPKEHRFETLGSSDGFKWKPGHHAPLP